MKSLLQLLKETVAEWWQDDAPMQAASVAFYTVFSLAPIFMITVAIASMIYGRESAREDVFRILESVLGSQLATAFRAALEEARVRSFLATALGIFVALIGGTAALAALQNVMNRVWDVAVEPGHQLKMFFQKRLLSFALLLGAGLLAIILVATSTTLAAIGRFLEGTLGIPIIVLEAAHFIISLVLVAAVFAVLFKFLPDVRICWSDVWVGAVGTSLLFTLGNVVLGIYLGRSTWGSAYGPATSLVLLLVWVYYCVQIFIFGAEFTQVHARSRGTPIEPAEHAYLIDRDLTASSF